MAVSAPNIAQHLILTASPGTDLSGLYAMAQRYRDGKVWQRPDNLDGDGNPTPPEGEGTFVPFADMDRARAAGTWPLDRGGGLWFVGIDCRCPDGKYRFLVYRKPGGRLATPAGDDELYTVVTATRPFTSKEPGRPVTVVAPRTVQPVQG